MSSAEISPDLEAAVARGPLRAWAERAARDLTLDAQRTAPPAKIWHTTGDDKVRPTHREADGQAVAVNVRFLLHKPEAGPTAHGQAEHAAHAAGGHQGGSSGNVARKPLGAGTELAAEPRDERLSPGNKINCRCDAVPAPEMIAATVRPGPVEVAGTMVRFRVSTGFNRAAESEFGDGDTPGLRWMGRALNTFAARLAGRG